MESGVSTGRRQTTAPKIGLEHHEGTVSESCLKQLRVHDLRHTFASLLLRKGRPAIEVAGLMGHNSVDITHRVYAHFDPATRDRQAADVLSSAVFKKAGGMPTVVVETGSED